MYGTAVNQLVTVAVFPDVGMVLQSIQLAGVSFRRSFAVKYPFSRATSVLRLHDSGTGDGHAIFVSGK